jgi:hypothetical protein
MLGCGGNLISDFEAATRAGNTWYHNACLYEAKCVECWKPLEEDWIAVKNEYAADSSLHDLYHNGCLVCMDCDQPLLMSDGVPDPEVLYLQDADRQYFHVACRICETCENPIFLDKQRGLDAEAPWVHSGQDGFLHQNCQDRCSQCDKPLFDGDNCDFEVNDGGYMFCLDCWDATD